MNTQERQQAADVIREARQTRGWSQADLARESGVSLSTVRNVERAVYAKPQRSVWLKLCDALGLDPDDPRATDGDPIRAKMPMEVRGLLDVLGGWLSALPPDRREAEIEQIAARIFG